MIFFSLFYGIMITIITDWKTVAFADDVIVFLRP